jgi:hypothetical protein
MIKNNMSDILTQIIGVLILIFIVYIIFIIILFLFNPQFYNSDGSINWLTPLWVSIILIIFFALFSTLIIECLG